MANNEEENTGTDISKVVRILGVSDTDHEKAMEGAKERARSELTEELKRPPTGSEISARSAQLYINGFIIPALKQGRALDTGIAKNKALAEQIKNLPAVRKKAIEDDLIAMMIKADQINLSTFENWKDRFNKHQDEIISEAIAAGIAPYKTMASLASLGVLFGGIAQMAGGAMNKPEWSEWGANTMATSIKMAEFAENQILALDKKGKILRNIDRTPEGFDQALDGARTKLAQNAALLEEYIVILMADDPEQRDHLLKVASEARRKMCLTTPGCAETGTPGTPGAPGAPGAPGSIPLSIRNKNPGNLRPVGATEGFQTFPTDEAGLKAMYDDLAAKISGQSTAMASQLGKGYSPTLRNLISVWAPPKENKTEAYIQRVARETGIKPDQVLTLADIPKLMTPMIAHEGGSAAVDYFRPKIEKMYGVPVVNGTDLQKKSNGITILKDKNGHDMKLEIDFSRASGQLDISGGTSGAGGITFDPNAAALSMDGNQGSFASGTRTKPFVFIEPPRPVGAGGQ